MWWQTVLGLLLLGFVSLYIFRFRKKWLGLAYILVFFIASQLFIALFTQALGIFSYAAVVVLNILLIIGVVWRAGWPRVPRSLRQPDWVLIIILAAAGLYLGSVHSAYTGTITETLTREYQEVQSMTYPYPYYADEWYAIAFIKDSIASGDLPLQFPYTRVGEHFPNFEAAFHSLTAGFIVLLGLDPLRHYTLLTVGNGALIVLIMYAWLRHIKTAPLPAAFAAVSALFITNGANLPGLWTLIPLMIGVPLLLLSLFFIAEKQWLMIFFTAGLAVILYPPLIVFILPMMILAVWQEHSFHWQMRRLGVLAAWFGLVVLVVSLFFFLGADSDTKNVPGYLRHIFDRLWYASFTPLVMPEYRIIDIVPWLVLVFAAIGVYPLWKSFRWFLGALGVGLLYWILYSFTNWRLVIEYQRVIVVTSLLLAAAAGVGMNFFWHHLRLAQRLPRGSFLYYGVVTGFAFWLVIWWPGYTARNQWSALTYRSLDSGYVGQAAAPANRYLHPDDVRLFSELHGQRFLSLPWKGTVIGAATDNHPLVTKPGTITLHSDLYDDFSEGDCREKHRLLRLFKADYVYVPPFLCAGFSEIGVSSEGLVLYRFDG